MKDLKEILTRCKYCDTQIIWLTKKGRYIPVNASSVTGDERLSLRMDLVVPFNAVDHTNHLDVCPKKQQQNPTNYLRY